MAQKRKRRGLGIAVPAKDYQSKMLISNARSAERYARKGECLRAEWWLRDLKMSVRGMHMYDSSAVQRAARTIRQYCGGDDTYGRSKYETRARRRK